MAIDIGSERLLTLRQAADLLPSRENGKKVAMNTVKRYCLRGCRGVFLEFEQIGGTKFTSVEALQRFSRAMKAGIPRPVDLKTARERQREREETYELARKQGFKV